MHVPEIAFIVVSILSLALHLLCLVAIVRRSNVCVHKKQRTPRHAEDDMGDEDDDDDDYVPPTKRVEENGGGEEGIDDGLLVEMI